MAKLDEEDLRIEQSEWDQLKTLLRLLESTRPFQLSGSPFAPISTELGDLFSQLARIVKGPFGPRLTPGLKFVETEDFWISEEEEAEWLESVGFRAMLPNGTSPNPQYDPTIKFDPNGTKVVDGVKYLHYYRYLESLGNPVQVEISYQSPKFQDDDVRLLSYFFDDVAQVMFHLARGIIDWRFIKNLRRFYVPKGPKTKSTPKQKHDQYYYRSRQHNRKGTRTKRKQK